MNGTISILTTALILTLTNAVVAAPRDAASSRTSIAERGGGATKSMMAISQTQGIVAPTGKSPIAKFECRSRGPSTGEILLQANGKYVNQGQTGVYQPFRHGYRFLTGKLKRQSIVRQQGNIYLVATENERRAAELAAADGALFCTGGEIKY